jgi:ribosomal protein S18 acetylase RimI-like enzyme
MDEKRFGIRAIKNGIDFEASVGVYDGCRMVGYTLVGVDRWCGELAAYDIGTGIVKTHRGRGIAREMFRFALPRLREKGVARFHLEVLQENERAVRAYRKSGFEITREFDCFELELESAAFGKNAVQPMEIRPMSQMEIESCTPLLDWEPSWENSLASIRRIPDAVTLIEAVDGGRRAGVAVYYPGLNWIMCIAVKKELRRSGIGTALVEHLVRGLGGDRRSVRLVNVDRSDAGMIAFLSQMGFRSFTTQYEMACPIG